MKRSTLDFSWNNFIFNTIFFRLIKVTEMRPKGTVMRPSLEWSRIVSLQTLLDLFKHSLLGFYETNIVARSGLDKS